MTATLAADAAVEVRPAAPASAFKPIEADCITALRHRPKLLESRVEHFAATPCGARVADLFRRMSLAKGVGVSGKIPSRRPRTVAAAEVSARARPEHRKPRRDTDPAGVRGGAFPIVGIGMSAGGLEVAIAFLRAMPADSGMGFVFVQHLDPTHESMLADLLARATTMPVSRITDGMRVEPNRVYVIVPAKTLVIEHGLLRLTEPTEPRGQRHPIDAFFSALAMDRTTKAIAVILSGAGSNGTAGLQDIKQFGGMCIAQDPKTAKFDSMPRHAINSGAIDLVLTAEMMPDALRRYVDHSYVESPKPEVIATGPGAELGDVLALLRTRGGHDFGAYKPNTLSRRTHRRMSLAGVEQLDDYMAILDRTPGEVTALTRDLLINVTGFFRDPEAWDALDMEVITPLVEKVEPDQSIRAWVPACSTGEEAYTIAMLLHERGEAAGKRFSVKIFATDPAEHNLGRARKGEFPASMVESLPAGRLARFFDKGDDDYYRIKPKIRETVMFAPQNLLTDPPYSRMDLVSCRNLLIYLEPDAQERVLSLAHFALREGGYLFLGNAETIGQRGHLFSTVSKRWRIYRRAGPARSPTLDVRAWSLRDAPTASSKAAPKIAEIALRSLAERFAPASVLIDPNFHVLHFHGLTEDYLSQPAGAPTLDLLSLTREGLRLPVRGAVRKVIEGARSVTLRSNAKGGAKTDRVLVTASALGDARNASDLILVSFAKDQGAAPVKGLRRTPRAAALQGRAERSAERDFQEELNTTRDELRDTIEQFETTNEELTAANEEVTSINEELQSTNEELESSKEELQSLNEELNTVNSQLERKVAELEDAGDDLRNLLTGSEIATIFLDVRMRIKWFTPAVKSLFDLIDKDVGRPIGNFTQKFTNGGLVEKAQAAIDRLETSEEDILADTGQRYLLRVLPYRTGDNRIAGAVATFIDITDLKATQAQIADARDYAEAIVETIRDPLVVLTADLRVQSANAAFYALLEAGRAKTVGQRIYELGGGKWNIPQLRLLLEEMLPLQHQISDFEVELAAPRSERRWLTLNARRIEGGQNRPDLILLAMEDISARKDSSHHQDILIGELSHRVKNTLTVVQSLATQTLRRSPSLEVFGEAFQGRLQALGRAHDTIIEGNWRGIGLRDLVEQALKPFQSADRIAYRQSVDVELQPQLSLALTMILHELATNAVKYGALSGAVGQVVISWRLEGAGAAARVAFDWTERGGPVVKRPTHRGHGVNFVERSVAYDLNGEGKVEFAAEGVKAVMCFPLPTAGIFTPATVEESD